MTYDVRCPNSLETDNIQLPLSSLVVELRVSVMFRGLNSLEESMVVQHMGELHAKPVRVGQCEAKSGVVITTCVSKVGNRKGALPASLDQTYAHVECVHFASMPSDPVHEFGAPAVVPLLSHACVVLIHLLHKMMLCIPR